MRVERPLLTPRLELRTLDTGAAAGPYQAWMNDAEVLRYLEARHQRHDAASLRAFITQANESGDLLLLGMHLRDTGAHVGNIKLGPIDWDNRRGEIGIIVGERNAQGKGLGTEALLALSRYAPAELGLHKLTAGFLDLNVGSARIFKKAGYYVEAVLKEHNSFDGQRRDVVRVALLTRPGAAST